MARRVMMLVPSALRRRLEIREVEPEVISPGDQRPWVLQLLAEGQLPGVNAEPLLRAVEPEPEQVPEEEPPAEPPIVDEPTLLEVVPTLVEVEPEPEPEPEPVAEAVPTPVEVEAEPELEPVLVAEAVEPMPEAVHEPAAIAPEPEPEPEPVAEVAVPEPRARPAPPRPARKRARSKHRPVKRVAPPQRAAAHVSTTADIEETEPPADDFATVACEIRIWRGYRKANFYACVFTDEGEALAVAESPSFRARGAGTPDKTQEAVAAYDALRQKLEEKGWQRTSAGKTWYGDVYSHPG